MCRRRQARRVTHDEDAEAYDFAFANGIPRQHIQELGRLGFVKRAENVMLLGPNGVGKARLARTVVVVVIRSDNGDFVRCFDRKHQLYWYVSPFVTGRCCNYTKLTTSLIWL